MRLLQGQGHETLTQVKQGLFLTSRQYLWWQGTSQQTGWSWPLQEGSYDWRLLPFIPKVWGMRRRVLVELWEWNWQWMPAARSMKELWEMLECLGIEAEVIACKTTLPLLVRLSMSPIHYEWVGKIEPWERWLGLEWFVSHGSELNHEFMWVNHMIWDGWHWALGLYLHLGMGVLVGGGSVQI